MEGIFYSELITKNSGKTPGNFLNRFPNRESVRQKKNLPTALKRHCFPAGESTYNFKNFCAIRRPLRQDDAWRRSQENPHKSCINLRGKSRSFRCLRDRRLQSPIYRRRCASIKPAVVIACGSFSALYPGYPPREPHY